MQQKANPVADAKPEYDVIVIGSGLAGMTGANVLATQGYRVALFEQHYNYGGLATWFKRPGGHTFDISLHGFPVGMVKSMRRYWGKEIADSIVPLQSIRFHNPQFSFETTFTREDYTEKVVRAFRLERTQVEAFYDHLRAMEYYNNDGTTTRRMLERFFPGRNDVHRAFMEPITYANGSTLDEPAVTYGIVFSNFMSKGVFTFSGGTDQLILRMRRILARNGVECFSGAEVEKILVENGRVVGARVNSRDIRARAVLSNANIKNTVLRLAGEGNFKPAFVEKTRAVRLSGSSCQVYIGIRRGESIPFITDLLFCSEAPAFSSEELCDLHTKSRTFSFYYPKTRPHLPDAGYTIVSSNNARWDDWANLPEADYEREKNALIERTVAHLEKFIPDVRGKIDHLEASTPRTFRFYAAHDAGASFGTKFEGLEVSQGLSEQLPGLYHAGSVGIIMSGWLGTVNYGVITAAKMAEYLYVAR
ncbi:MAG: NAD(P)/FAD-dependent oxidoreductase [Planctomycetes bacterium]|nr:NAD(P)/FAD-dependent oxidoreductase [Planctomycetota bacterium]